MALTYMLCNHVLCDVKEHVNGFCKLHDDIISACLDASEIIPETGMTSKKIPGASHTASVKSSSQPSRGGIVSIDGASHTVGSLASQNQTLRAGVLVNLG